MAEVTVKELADLVGASVDRLLAQMKQAGLRHESHSETVTYHDKQVLLTSLKQSHGEYSQPRKISLQRKTLSSLNSQKAKASKSIETGVPEIEQETSPDLEDVPKVFISYSYDSPEHELWVEQLAKMLRSDGIEAVLDRWYLHPGDPITEFMEVGIRESDFVLIVCTENYKQKSDARQGGVGYEEAIISSDMLSNSNHRKYIPVVKSRDYSKAVPTALHSKKYINLSSEDVFSPSYRDLLLTLYGRRPEAPPIGKAPSYVRS